MKRFVILEHVWQGVHWDLMFEREDVLRTWAIDEAIVPGVVLPARALADHRLHYLDYEGEIGGGRGTVRRLDRGRYEADLWGTDLVRLRLHGAQLVGTVELRRIDIGSSVTPFSWSFRLGNFD